MKPSLTLLLMTLWLVGGCTLFTTLDETASAPDLGEAELDMSMFTPDLGKSEDMGQDVTEEMFWEPPGPAFFVGIDGDDTNEGTLESPWATFAFATSQLSADDTLFILEGTYSEPLIPMTDGLPGRPLYIRAYRDHEVVIEGAQVNLELVGRNYINLRKLTLRNPVERWALIEESNHIVLEDISGVIDEVPLAARGEAEHEGVYIIRSQFIHVIRLDVRNWRRFADGSQDGHALATRSTSDLVIQDSHFGASGTSNLESIGGENILVTDSVISNPWAACVYVYDIDGFYFIRNEIAGCARNDGSYATGIDIRDSSRATIRGNSIHDTARAIDFTADDNDRIASGRVAHNTVFDNSSEGLSIDDTGAVNVVVSDMDIVNNVFSRNSAGSSSSAVQLFVNDEQPATRLLQVNVRGNLFSNEAAADCRASLETGVNGNTCPITWDGSNGDVAFFEATPQFENNGVDDEVFEAGSLELAPDSPGVDSAEALTHVLGSGTSASVVVEDSFFFHDSFGGMVPGDRIMIGDTPAEIVSILRATHTLVLDEAITYEDGDPIGLDHLGAGADVGARESF